MKLSTGKVAFPIEFDNGDKAVIYINPNDKGIQERIKEFKESIEKRISEINLEKYKSRFANGKNVDIDIDNLDQLLDKPIEELEEIQNRLSALNDIEAEYNKAIRDELDEVFNSNMSDSVFKYCQPFDMVTVEDENGNETQVMFILHFIRGLMAEMKKYIVANNAAMERHLSKYTK